MGFGWRPRINLARLTSLVFLGNEEKLNGYTAIIMKKQTIQFVRSLLFIPFLTTSSPFAMTQSTQPVIQQSDAKQSHMLVLQERADKIETYFKKRKMPLAGQGMTMVLAAEENNIDWRLLPAIAIKESTGGKFACGKNPFGWGSCKIKFDTWETAIATVARNLGGNNPATARYYKDATTEKKLYHYNGSVIPTYTAEILEFMDLIERRG